MENLFSKRYSPTAGNTLLFIMVCFTIFAIPLFPVEAHRILYNLSFTAIFVMAVFSVEGKRHIILGIAAIATITEWMAAYMDLTYITIISYGINVIFFTIVVGKMIYDIARTKIVNLRVIVEAINGYLLVGFIFSVLVTFVMIFNPQAYNFPNINSPSYYNVSHVSDYLYYAFVTFTTLGYGDIVPQIPVARSLAILTSITGQIYIAIIIALLVGKFAGSQTDK